MSSNASLEAIQAVFRSISQLPYCSGTVPLTSTTSNLFYATSGKAELIDFTKATDGQLAALSEACQQATFGVNQQDVLDESYRKAGKLDASAFATQFSPFTCGIVDTIRDSLLAAEHAEKSIKVELYKLNVYGPGSFFKAHVDTPRSETMFGSLVIVLPTIHEGGSLIVRHDGHEQVFDTALAVKSENTPYIAFIAFYSDVEHEVALVTSGYRVTITYNLYFNNSPTSALHPLVTSNDHIKQLKSSLSTLLVDSEFLPHGGLLGFGLSHRYPVNPSTTKLTDLVEHLKGSDADTIRICKALSLDVTLKALYVSRWGKDYGACLLDQFADLGDEPIEDDVIEYINTSYEGIMVNSWKNRNLTPMVWIKPLAESNAFKATYLAYGNEASMGYTYGEVCLVASIGAAEERDAN